MLPAQNNIKHNKALQLIHKSGAPIVAPLLLSTELNRYVQKINKDI